MKNEIKKASPGTGRIDPDQSGIEFDDPLEGCISEYSRFFSSRSMEEGLIRGIDYRHRD